MQEIPFFLHDLGPEEVEEIARVFATPMLTTGETVQAFESQFSSFLGVNHTLGVAHCTGAIHLSLLALGIGQGDEVITTPLTFIATSTAIMESGATPVFVDVEPETGNLNADNIEAAITDRTRAIVPVHLYGHMCDMKALRSIADRYNLAIIEDAAHCMEGSREGIRAGHLGDTACFSFFATKNITCGEGGAVVTNREDLYQKMKLLHLHGMTQSSYDRYKQGYAHWDMTVMGWKYNMSNIQAAMLLPQLKRIQENVVRRKALADYYKNKLRPLKGIRIPACLPGVVHAHHLFTIWVEPAIRNIVIQELQNRNIGVAVNYRAIHQLTYFKERFGYRDHAFPVAKDIGDRTISLPFYPHMPLEHVDQITEVLSQIV